MLHSGKNIYSNSCVVRKKNSERNKKPYPPPPPLQVKWSVPYILLENEKQLNTITCYMTMNLK